MLLPLLLQVLSLAAAASVEAAAARLGRLGANVASSAGGRAGRLSLPVVVAASGATANFARGLPPLLLVPWMTPLAALRAGGDGAAAFGGRVKKLDSEDCTTRLPAAVTAGPVPLPALLMAVGGAARRRGWGSTGCLGVKHGHCCKARRKG